ncbi:hypothetical protein PAXRUDRAFT_17827 [Paxillus rubicundulus Ve08.2h10]|uniref:Uncharacterized protein n=1 Tax=Paxillus rubicundulus Ve08.2h10 TaxID=930991 RepID=A0A0D0DGE7_9AGAM|nr:hypothetical protein PAXRUDRAFT_17827 [Paxillus rubicundulus Ve08.2h10]
MEWEGEGGGEGGIYQDGGKENQFGMDVDGPSNYTNQGKSKAMGNFPDPTPLPEHFQVSNKGAMSAYNSHQAGFQFTAAKAHAINSCATSCAASRAASLPSCATSHPPLSHAVSCPPSDGQLFSLSH